MKKSLLSAAVLFVAAASMNAQHLSWTRVQMDGSRTGCKAPGAENVEEALGSVKGRRYNAPNGRTYRGGSLPKVASAVLAVQPRMADLKAVVGTCPEGMVTYGADSPLANFATDIMLAYAEQVFGEKADFAVLNSGGIRGDVPAGDVLKEDMVAIFPFHNHLVLVEYPGQVLLDYLEQQAGSRRPQPFAGIRMTVSDRHVVEASVGGEPIDPSRNYQMVTIDFLLGSGDNMRLAKGATGIKYSKIDVIDVVLDYMVGEKEAGRTVQGVSDGRLTVIKH